MVSEQTEQPEQPDAPAAGAEPAALRGEVHHHGSAPNGVTVLNDSYNATPDSMRVAFETLRDLAAAEPHRRRVVVPRGN